MKEADVMRQVMIAASRAGARLWRNNSGVAWAGKVIKITSLQRVAVGPGDVVIRNARPLHAGLCTGSSDLIGATPVLIEERHLGMKMAVFSAVEVKSADGSTTTEQADFVQQIQAMGGLAGIAKSPDDALRILSGWAGKA